MLGTFLLAVLGSACEASDTVSPAAPTTVEKPAAGGTLVLGANQEPNCADWYGACGSSSWGIDMMANQTLPRPFTIVDFEYRPTPLLVSEPTLEAGPPQRVTYRIEPLAVWSDGRPVTSSDFRFTFDQTKTSRIASTVASIAGVDDADPKVAVVTYGQPDPAWRDKFALGLLPKHLLEGKDRAAEMGNGYRWSAGPWLIGHWTKEQEIRLVPNPTYWGARPHLDAVVFKVIADTAAYQAAYKTGQVDMIFLQGAQPTAAELKNLPDSSFDARMGLTYEAVNFNVSKPPLDSRAVRQALAYASDRDAIVTQLSGPFLPGIKPAQTFRSPVNKKWYSEPFARYRRDPSKVNELMTGDRWTRGPDGVWAKGGARAAIEFSTTAGNRRRELTQEILTSQWRQAGFDVTINNPAPTTLLGDWHPKGTFHVSLSGFVPVTPEPNACATFCARNIPTEGKLPGREHPTNRQPCPGCRVGGGRARGRRGQAGRARTAGPGRHGRGGTGDPGQPGARHRRVQHGQGGGAGRARSCRHLLPAQRVVLPDRQLPAVGRDYPLYGKSTSAAYGGGVEEVRVRRVIRCDCGFEAIGISDDDLVPVAQAHTKAVHGTDVSAELVSALARPHGPGTRPTQDRGDRDA